MTDKIKIGDKEYSLEELGKAIEDSGKLQNLQEQVAPVLEMAQRYKLEPKELVRNAEGAFSRFVELQEAGILDDEGMPVERKVEKPPTLPKVPASPEGQKDINVNALEEIVKRAVGPLQQKIQQLGDYQGRLFRERIMERVHSKYPEMTEEDVSIASAKASANKGDFWKIIDERAEAVSSAKEQAVKAFAAEHGLNIEELNQLKEMRSDEGSIASAIVEGKKVSSKGGEGTVTPKQAMIDFMETADRLERSGT